MGLGVERLEALFVHPEHRGKDIGRTLVYFASTLHPILDTEVNARNEQALGFYRRWVSWRSVIRHLDDQGRAYPLIRMRLPAEAIRWGRPARDKSRL